MGCELQPTGTVNNGKVERDDSKRELRKSKSRDTATGKLEGNLKWVVSFAEILETGQREFRQPSSFDKATPPAAPVVYTQLQTKLAGDDEIRKT